VDVNTLIDYEDLAKTIAREIMFCPPGYMLVKGLKHPWPEHEARLRAAESLLAPAVVPVVEVGAGKTGSSNPIRKAIEHAAEVAAMSDDDQQRIPDGDTVDTLLSSVRGRWRMPPPWSRESFESIFGERLEVTLGKIKVKTWTTPNMMAKPYRRQPSWITTSLRWCLVREGLLTSDDDFLGWFPLSKKKRSSSNVPG
jgi:hypothetical protein